jgi:ribonuclease HI
VDGPDPTLQQVVELELELLDPVVRSDPRAVSRLLHPDFSEIGASGVLWDRVSIVQALAEAPGTEVLVSDLLAGHIAEGVVLVTYRAETGTGAARRISLHSSLWTRAGGEWQVLFHQGTLAAPGS